MRGDDAADYTEEEEEGTEDEAEEAAGWDDNSTAATAALDSLLRAALSHTEHRAVPPWRVS